MITKSSRNRFSEKLLGSAYKKLVATQLIGEFVLIYPLYSIMFRERSGISAAGVGLLLAAWQITQIIAEIPTGLIADRYSKKYAIVIGRLCKMICFGIWFMAPNFGGYLAGFIVWGVGEAFISGAMQAYIYELSVQAGDTNYLKSFSKIKAMNMFSYTAAYFCTFLIGPRYQLLVGLTIVILVISFVLSLTLPTTKALQIKTVRHLLSSAKQNILQSSVLKQKFLHGLVIAGTLEMLVEYITVNYHDFGASTRITPLLISFSAGFSSVTFWLLHYYQEFFKRRVVALTIIFAGIYSVMFSMSTWWQILGLFLVARFMRILAVIQEAGLQSSIDESARATVLSTYSLLTRLLSASQIFLVGFLATGNNITHTTFWFVIASLAIFVLLRTRRNVEHN